MDRGTSAPSQITTRRRRYTGRDLTTGSIPRNLWFLAWPQTVSGSLMVVDRMWDLFLAGFLGFRVIAGIGVAQSWSMLAFTVRMGFDTSMRAMISRAVGAGDLKLARHVAFQGFTLSTTISLVLTIVGILLTEFLMRILGISEEVIAVASNYMKFQLLATMFQGLMMMTGTALQASGDPITPMKAQIVSRVLHFGLSPLLMFGWFWFPSFGITGAALAALIAGIVALIWNLTALFRGTSLLHLSIQEYRLDLPMIWRMIRIGTPASITSMERSLSQIAVVWLVAMFGDMALAAYAVAQRTQMLTNLGSMGLGQGAGILVGQSLGAGKPERAKQTVAWALLFVIILSITLGGILLIFSKPFLSIFLREPEVMEIAVPWLRIVVLGFMVQGTGMVFTQSYNTAGDTFVPMIVSLITIWGIQVPLAIMLSGVTQNWSLLGTDITLPTIGSLGQYGIAWAIVLAMGLRLFLYGPYFFTGRWLKKRVFSDETTPRTPTEPGE